MKEKIKTLKENYVEYTPDIIPVTVGNHQDEFLYGKSVEKIDYNSLKNAPVAYVLPTATTSVLGGVKVDGTTITISSGVISASGGAPFIGYFTVTATGSKVITGVGFMPSMVQFFYTNQAGGSGTGSMTALSQFAHDYMGSGSSSQTECIYLRDTGSTAVCRATRTSFDSGGFTINITTNSGTNRVDFIATQ